MSMVTSAREAAEVALKGLLNDKIGGGNTEAYLAAMAYCMDMVENGVDDLEEIATLGGAFYDGYVAALQSK